MAKRRRNKTKISPIWIVMGVIALLFIFSKLQGFEARKYDTGVITFDGDQSYFWVNLEDHPSEAVIGESYGIEVRITNADPYYLYSGNGMFIQCSILNEEDNPWLSDVSREVGVIDYPTQYNCVPNEPFTKTKYIFFNAGERYHTETFTVTVPGWPNSKDPVIYCEAFEQCWAPGRDTMTSDSFKHPITISGVDECSPGEKVCSGDGYKTCIYDSTDARWEWSSVTACSVMEDCENGECVPIGCEDECMQNQRECVGSSGYHICEYHASGSGGCWEWGNTRSCDSDEECKNGACVKTCTDACGLYESQCLGAATYRTCVNNGGCNEWSGEMSCPSGTICLNGQCITEGSDECPEDDHGYCINFASTSITPPYDSWAMCEEQSDGFNDWKDITKCEDDEVCSLNFDGEGNNCCLPNGVKNLFPGFSKCCSGCILFGTCVMCEEEGCGDGICSSDESCSTCPEDCGDCAGDYCGDGTCSADESCSSCPQDCGVCGDNETSLGQSYINPSNKDEWCVSVPGITDPCFPRKDYIYLSELDELEKVSGLGLISMIDDEENPICYVTYGDVQCKEDSECLKAVNKKSSAYKENKKVYDALDHVIGTKGALSWVGMTTAKLFGWVTGIDIREDGLEEFGVCVPEKRGMINIVKNWIANLFDWDIDDKNVDYAFYGMIIVGVLIVYLLMKPPRPRYSPRG